MYIDTQCANNITKRITKIKLMMKLKYMCQQHVQKKLLLYYYRIIFHVVTGVHTYIMCYTICACDHEQFSSSSLCSCCVCVCVSLALGTTEVNILDYNYSDNGHYRHMVYTHMSKIIVYMHVRVCKTIVYKIMCACMTVHVCRITFV